MSVTRNPHHVVTTRPTAAARLRHRSAPDALDLHHKHVVIVSVLQSVMMARACMSDEGGKGLSDSTQLVN